MKKSSTKPRYRPGIHLGNVFMGLAMVVLIPWIISLGRWPSWAQWTLGVVCLGLLVASFAAGRKIISRGP